MTRLRKMTRPKRSMGQGGHGPARAWLLAPLGALLALAMAAGAEAGSPRGEAGGIRAFDWGNFHYARSTDPLNNDPADPITLHGGRSRPAEPGDFEITRLAAVRYADFLGGGGTEAAVELVTPVAARRGEDENVYVFAWRDGRPRQIFFGMYSEGARISVSGRALVIRQPGASPAAPWSRIVLRWHNGRFRPTK